MVQDNVTEVNMITTTTTVRVRTKTTKETITLGEKIFTQETRSQLVLKVVYQR